MVQQEDITYVISDPNSGSMILASKILEGIRAAAEKNRMTVAFVNSPGQIGPPTKVKAAIVVGVKKSWVRGTIQQLRSVGLKPVLAGAEKADFGSDVSGAGFARQTLVEDLVKYFFYAGRRRLASLGNESVDVNDAERIRAFINTVHSLGMSVDEGDIYTFDRGSQSCMQAFLENVHRYDGVICVNDYVAIQLIRMLNEQGVSVPEKLFVAGSGDMFLGKCITPSLTTTTLDYYNIGIQSVNICRMLDQDPSIDTVSIMVPSKLVCRASTGYETPPPPAKVIQSMPAAAFAPKREDPVYWLKTLEDCLQQCDQLDYRILQGTLGDLSTDQLAEQVFVAPGTVQYRLKKLYEAVGVKTKKELIETTRPYLCNLEALISPSESL